MPVTRRNLMQSAAAAPLVPRPNRRPNRPRLAMLCTTFFKQTGCQHIIDRLLGGYGWQGQHHRPEVDLVSIYVEQTGAGDLTADRLRRHPNVRIFPTIGETLTGGGSTLDVDGVLIVADNGRYARNDRGQILYPRFEFFEETLKIFRMSNRSVPIWNAKHLSWSWERAREMYDDAAALGVPFMAGSPVPLTARLPAVDVPFGTEVKDALCVGPGPADGAEVHSLEALQAMVERRRGGESGVKWVQAWKGEAFWQALDDGLWSVDLMTAALCRSQKLAAAPVPINGDTDYSHWRALLKEPQAYQYQHSDGLRSTLLLLDGLVRDISFAARVGARRELLSTLFHQPTAGGHPTLANHYSPLVNHLEAFFQTGRPTFPIERTLLTTGIAAEALESHHAGGARIDTPHLEEIRYAAPRTSQFWRL